MESKKVLVALPIDEAQQNFLKSCAPDYDFTFTSIPNATEEMIADANIIIGNVMPERMHTAKKLEWLQLNSAGADPYCVPGFLSPNTILTTANGAYGKTVSEHMLAMLLCLQRKLHLYRDGQAQHSWDNHGAVTSISDATVLVVGIGDIGRRFAKLVHALGAYVIGVKRTPGSCPEYVDEPHLMKDLKDLLPHADVVISFLPSTKETKGLFTKELFHLMKPTAIFLNGGRGDAVCTEDLCDVLEEGHLAAVGLDVTDPEPLPKDHRLWTYPNAFITPHVSGFFYLRETLDRVVSICGENLKRYAKGDQLKNIMNFETGYCSDRKSSK